MWRGVGNPVSCYSCTQNGRLEVWLSVFRRRECLRFSEVSICGLPGKGGGTRWCRRRRWWGWCCARDAAPSRALRPRYSGRKAPKRTASESARNHPCGNKANRSADQLVTGRRELPEKHEPGHTFIPDKISFMKIVLLSFSNICFPCEMKHYSAVSLRLCEIRQLRTGEWTEANLQSPDVLDEENPIERNHDDDDGDPRQGGRSDGVQHEDEGQNHNQWSLQSWMHLKTIRNKAKQDNQETLQDRPAVFLQAVVDNRSFLTTCATIDLLRNSQNSSALKYLHLYSPQTSVVLLQMCIQGRSYNWRKSIK